MGAVGTWMRRLIYTSRTLSQQLVTLEIVKAGNIQRVVARMGAYGHALAGSGTVSG